RSFDDWWLPLRYVLFEPEPEEAQLLRRSEARGSFEVEEIAVGDRVGRRPFHVYALERAGSPTSRELSSLLPLAPQRAHRYRDADVRLAARVEMRLETIDAVAARLGYDVTFLVADVQGAELIALEGARTALRDSLL